MSLRTPLAVGGLLSLTLIGPLVAAGDPPDKISLMGIVRDFHATHADFQAAPDRGFGTYCGLVDETMGPGARPVFIGSGNKVMIPATDSGGRVIAPHLVNQTCSSGVATPPVLTDGRVRGRNTSVFDGYDSSDGIYGGANILPGIIATNSIDPGMVSVDNSSTLNGDAYIGPGGDPAVVVDIQGTMTGTVEILDEAIPLPNVVEPGGLPVYPGGDLDVPMNGSYTLDASWHINGEFDIKRNATVTVDGNVTVLCEDRWLIGKDATVVIPDGSSLTIYCRTQARLYGTDTVVNPDTSDPSKLEIYMLGADIWNDQIVLNGAGTVLCAKVVARGNIIDLDQRAEFFGTFAGAAVEINNQSKLHVDIRDFSLGGMQTDPGMGDTAADLDPVDSNGAVTSGVTFDQWFSDVPGTNLSLPAPIDLVRQIDDTYLFDDATDPDFGPMGGFYPIDDRLFGNDGDTHNHHFTYMFNARFIYDGSAAQFFSCTADADVWVFVDDQMGLDLGGVHPSDDQRIELDRLCLQDGQQYWLTFFMAKRYAPASSLRVHTNIVFEGTSLPAVTAAFD